LHDANAVPVLVHSTSRDSVEALNHLLRDNGMTAHCTWIPSAEDIGDALEQLNPELLVSFDTPLEELAEIAQVRDQVAQSVPLLVLRDQGDESLMSADMLRGARDSATLTQPDRVAAIIRRELRSFRLERTLTSTLHVAQDYRQKLQTVLRRSKDAIAQVQEGIIVDANASWLEMLGYEDASAVVGQPVMDLFDADTQTPLRGALSACARGRWSDLPLKTGARAANGETLELPLQLAQGEFDGEPCVQLIVPADRRDAGQIAKDLAATVHQDPATGLWTRRRLLELIDAELKQPVPGGARFLVCIRPDRLMDIENEIGVLHTDEFLTQFALLVRSQLAPKDLLGHFGGTNLMLLGQRGNTRDLEAWCENLIDRIAHHNFTVGDRVIHTTCTLGASQAPNHDPDANALVMQALNAARRGRDRGGNRLVFEQASDQDSRVKAYDEVWVRHIRTALAENRFRLVQQPIASLSGDGQKVFDVAVRMLDLHGKDVLPSEFLPAAARNDLLRDIDRWVVTAALNSIATRRPHLLFVRLSADSLRDPDFASWLGEQLTLTRAEPARLCLQVTEADATQYTGRTQVLLGRARQLGVRTAIEHFGAGRDSLNLLNGLELDFLKIDGSLMQGLAGNTEQQGRIRQIAEAAARLKIQTVAERIEDANTMAIVWQLGVQYIQGYLVHAPEEVVLTG